MPYARSSRRNTWMQRTRCDSPETDSTGSSNRSTRNWRSSHEKSCTGGGGGMLRLVKVADPPGAEQVRPAEKDEGHMKQAEQISGSRCNRCWGEIGHRPFYRVNDNLYH